MPGLSYPFVFECSNCENQIIIDRGTVGDLFKLSAPDFDFFYTINAVHHQRGWMRDELDHYLFCPDCANVEAK
jgi:hypothetical protein